MVDDKQREAVRAVVNHKLKITEKQFQRFLDTC
jgi:hypothetical protein